MALTLDDLRESHIEYIAYTEGGGTYRVNGKPMCLSYLQASDDVDGYCSRPSGWGTEHSMLGRCKYHDGGKTERRFITGRYNKWTKARLRDEYEDFITDPELMNLGPELAMLRTILRETIIEYEASKDFKALAFANTVLDNTGRMVERMEKIQSTHVLTAATARYLITKGMEVARQFIPEGQMFTFVETWRSEVHAALSGVPQIVDQDMEQ